MTAWVRPTDEHWTLCLCNKIDSYRGVARVDIHHLATKLLKAGTSWWYKRLWRIQPSHQRGFERCNNYTMAEMCVSTDMPEGTSLSLPRPVLLPIRPSFHTRVGSLQLPKLTEKKSYCRLTEALREKPESHLHLYSPPSTHPRQKLGQRRM